jgi:zinc protease
MKAEMSFRFWVGVASISVGLALAAPRAAWAQVQPQYDAGNEAYAETRLPNGLRVYLAEDHRVPLVAITVSFPVGRLLDPPGARGLSEVIATLLPSSGTRHLPQGGGELIRAAGFGYWDIDAYAGSEYTELWQRVPTGAVDIALFLAAERMGFSADGVSSGEVAWAKDRVRKQYEQKQLSPEAGAIEALTFGPEHPRGAEGLPPQLDKIDLGLVQRRMRRFYNVADATISLVGDFDAKRVAALITTLFGKLKG